MMWCHHRRSALGSLAALAMLCAFADPARAASKLAPPAALVAELPSLAPVARFADLPAAIRAGDFTVDGTSARGWRMAEPGGAFNATDTPLDPQAPGRRMIFAACSARVCALGYERGGIAHFYEVLAFERGSRGWTAIWNAVGPKPLTSLHALRRAAADPASAPGWADQWVKGDF